MNVDDLKKNKRPRKYFTRYEDFVIEECQKLSPPPSWEAVSQYLPLRTPRQCRDRWINYLSPAINRKPWSIEEDKLLFEKVTIYGKKWSEIAKYFRDRSNNQLKNRWYFHLSGEISKNKDCLNSTKETAKDLQIKEFWDEKVSEEFHHILAQAQYWGEDRSSEPVIDETQANF